MLLVAGLGNPGAEYEHSPHNAGFLVIDKLAATLILQGALDRLRNARF